MSGGYKLVVVSGPDQGRAFALELGQPFVIGRGRTSQTQIQDPKVSRVHCHIEWQGGRAILVDEGTPAGTTVNGRKVRRAELAAGTLFQIGDSVLRFETPMLDQPTIPPGSAVAKRTQTPPLHELIGKKLGEITLEKIITPTRSGMLFQGLDLTHKRAVAVKVLTPDLMNLERQKARFIRAMKTMLPLRHENIVTIYNAGRSGPFCWTAMELIDGENMTQVIERIGIDGMLDWRDAWRVAMYITRALCFAYEKKIIHRNLTPTNILRRKSDKVCLLGDLMLAKGLEGAVRSEITEPGMLLGELPYLSPERTYPDADVDTRSDLYGLGATLYGLITGRPPFAADDPEKLVRMIRDDTPWPPREFQMAISGDFEDLVLQLLAKKPAKRFQNPQECLRALERIGHFTKLSL